MLSALGMSAEADPSGVSLKNGVWQYSDSSPLFFHVGDIVPGESNCAGTCATLWAVLVAEDTDGAPSGYWTIEKQPDGRRIWAYERKPVYRMINPDRTGYKNSSTQWIRADVTRWFPAGVGIVDNGYGTDILGMMDGRKLRVPRFKCDDDCNANWTPLEAPADAVDVQDWLVTSDAEGRRVWAYRRADSHIYVENQEPMVPAPVPTTDPRYTAPSMTAIVPDRLFLPTAGPITLSDGAYDVHATAITKAPRIAPGLKAPEYPNDSLRAGEAGSVGVQLCINSIGAVTTYKIVRSSGFPRLDAATEAWVPTIGFVPGLSVDGPVDTCGYTFFFDWALRDSRK